MDTVIILFNSLKLKNVHIIPILESYNIKYLELDKLGYTNFKLETSTNRDCCYNRYLHLFQFISNSELNDKTIVYIDGHVSCVGINTIIYCMKQTYDFIGFTNTPEKSIRYIANITNESDYFKLNYHNIHLSTKRLRNYLTKYLTKYHTDYLIYQTPEKFNSRFRLLIGKCSIYDCDTTYEPTTFIYSSNRITEYLTQSIHVAVDTKSIDTKSIINCGTINPIVGRFIEPRRRFNYNRHDEQYIIPFIHQFDKRDLPERFIIYQLEPLHLSAHIDIEDLFIKYQMATEIWDYNEYNINFLDKYYHTRYKNISNKIRCVPIPRLKIEHNITNYKIKPKYDILFYGSNCSRRKKILSLLKRQFNNIYVPDKYIYGENLFSLIRNSKILINIHSHELSLLETYRLHEAIYANPDIRIISEKCKNENSSIYEQYPEIDFIEIIDLNKKDSLINAYKCIAINLLME